MNDTSRKVQRTPSDERGCRRWVVLTGSLLSVFQFHVTLYAHGVLYILLLKRFGEGEARTALVGSVYSAVFCFTSVITSALINVFSCRVVCVTGSVLHVLGLALTAFVPSLSWTILTLGVITGLGHSLSNGASICVIGYYFSTKRDTFMSLPFFIVCFSIMLTTPFLLYLTAHHTYEEICLILASINAQGCIYGMSARPSALEKISKRGTETLSRHEICIVDFLQRVKSIFDISLLANFSYVCFLLTLIAWMFALLVIIVHFPNYIALRGGTDAQIGFLMFLFSVANAIGRICAFFIINRMNKHMLLSQNVTLAISGLMTASFPVYAHFSAGSYIFLVQLGFFLGFPNAMMASIGNSFVDVSKIPDSIGFSYIFCGFGMAAGPAAAGALYSWTRAYSSSFILAGIILLLGSMIGLLSQKCRKPVVSHRGSCESEIKKEQTISINTVDDGNLKHKDESERDSSEEHAMLEC